MAKEWAKPFYKSKAWKQCRSSYIKSVDGLCERCLCKGKIVSGYILHHKTYITPTNINDPNVTLNWDNLEYVCKRCHDNEHGVGRENKTVRDGLMFDEQGNLVKK